MYLLDINWGSSTQAFLYAYSMRNLLKLEKLEQHVKNFRWDFGCWWQQLHIQVIV